MRFVGIDPGATGGVAWIDGDSVEVAKRPQDEANVCELLEMVVAGREVRVVMEKVGGFMQSAGPKCPVCHQQPLRQPGHTMFNFGRGTGVLAGCLYSLGVRFDETEPARWQAIYRLPLKGKPQGERKRLMKEHAQRLYPGVKVTLATADALLLARYCMLRYRGPAEAVQPMENVTLDLFDE